MLPKRLKFLRKQNNMTQKTLSKKLNVSQQTIGSWEIGRTEPNNDNLQLLANLFSVSTDYLIGKNNNPNQIKVTDNTQRLSIEIHNLLIEKGIITKNEELTEEKIKWLQKLIGQAIDLSKL